MDKINGINIKYDEKMSNTKKEKYFNIIRSIIKNSENIFNREIDNYIVREIQLHYDREDEWREYEGFFIHIFKVIKIKISEKELDLREEIYFREMLIHEIIHGVFEQKMITNNNFYLYQKQDAWIIYINEYLAYYNTYKYINECYKKEFSKKLEDYWKESKGDIKAIFDKYNGIMDELTERDMKKLINSIARNIALLQFQNNRYKNVIYERNPNLRNIANEIDYKLNQEIVEINSNNLLKYLKDIMWVEK